MGKHLLVVCHCVHGLSMLVGMFKNLKAGDDASFDFIDDHMPAKLHQGSPFVPGDRPCVWLKQTEDFFSRCHFLALQHSDACLGDDSLDQGKNLLSLIQEAACLWLSVFLQSHDDLLALPD